nr:hypothetical protein Iba_chr03aCG5890 [Ipomoea batatas]
MDFLSLKLPNLPPYTFCTSTRYRVKACTYIRAQTLQDKEAIPGHSRLKSFSSLYVMYICSVSGQNMHLYKGANPSRIKTRRPFSLKSFSSLYVLYIGLVSGQNMHLYKGANDPSRIKRRRPAIPLKSKSKHAPI